MKNYTMRYSVLRTLCDVLTLAVIGILVLSAVSCRSQRSVEGRTTFREDSLRQVSTESVTVETEVQAVPGDSVSLTVPMTVIQNLPEGAMFSQKKGRTRISLKRDGDNIVANAESDRIGREVQRYERRARDALRQGGSEKCEASNESTKQPGTSPWLAVMTAVSLFVVSALLIVINKRLK